MKLLQRIKWLVLLFFSFSVIIGPILLVALAADTMNPEWLVPMATVMPIGWLMVKLDKQPEKHKAFRRLFS